MAKASSSEKPQKKQWFVHLYHSMCPVGARGVNTAETVSPMRWLSHLTHGNLLQHIIKHHGVQIAATTFRRSQDKGGLGQLFERHLLVHTLQYPPHNLRYAVLYRLQQRFRLCNSQRAENARARPIQKNMQRVS